MNRITVNGQTIEVEGNNVSVINGTIYVDGVRIDVNDGQPLTGNVNVNFEGDIANVRVDRGSVTVQGNVQGNVNAGGEVNCGHVKGSVDAGNAVHCGNVGKDVDAGNSVNCGDVGGDVDAGNNIRCSSHNNPNVRNKDFSINMNDNIVVKQSNNSVVSSDIVGGVNIQAGRNITFSNGLRKIFHID